MIRPQTLHLHRIRTLFNCRHPSLFYPETLAQTHLISSIQTKYFKPSSIFSRSVSLSSLFQHEFATQEANQKLKKPLEPLFTEAIGLSKSDMEDGEDENEKLNKSLEKLEVELRRYREDSTKQTKSLSGTSSKPLETVFTEALGLDEVKDDDQELKTGLENISNLFTSSDKREKKSQKQFKKVEESMEFKELSPDMAMFANHLHTKGYLINANFLPNNKFDVSCFVNNYGRDFLKYAAEKFAMDHREVYKHLRISKPQRTLTSSTSVSIDLIGVLVLILIFGGYRIASDLSNLIVQKDAPFLVNVLHRENKLFWWLPNGDLKKVAQFGCPSLGRKNVFSAKAMRFYFGIQEETVCNKCTLNESCKFVNQSVWKRGGKNMDLTVVMRVITLYALDAEPTQLEVPDDVKKAVNRLLKEVIRLSEA